MIIPPNHKYPLTPIILDHDTMKRRILEEENFIAMRRFSYNIDKLETRYNECPYHVIGQALLLTEEEVETEVQKLILKLRNLMGVSV